VGGVAAAASLVLPATVSSAAVSRPQPSLDSLVAQAWNLGHQIDVLSEQYDGLSIQLTEARNQAKTAMTTYRQDATRLVSGQTAIGELAAESYMNGGLATPLQVLTSTNTSTMLSRAAIMQQLQTQNGDRVSALATAEAAARRGSDTEVTKMVAVLRRRSQEFAALWDTHDVAVRRMDHKRIVHPMLGVIELDCYNLLSEDGRQRLLWFTAPPGSPGAEQLELLSVVGTQELSVTEGMAPERLSSGAESGSQR